MEELLLLLVVGGKGNSPLEIALRHLTLLADKVLSRSGSFLHYKVNDWLSHLHQVDVYKRQLYACVTYLFEGSADQSVLLDPDLTDVAAQAEAMQGSSGVVGMHLMHLMVNEWVGLGVIFVIILLLAMGLGLLGPAKVNYPKLIIFSTIATFWTSLFCATIFLPIAASFFFYPGGILGETRCV